MVLRQVQQAVEVPLLLRVSTDVVGQSSEDNISDDSRFQSAPPASHSSRRGRVILMSSKGSASGAAMSQARRD